ncbi:hypothetical protein J7355_16275 [Endozoicomonas sp. G2_2]|uniref:hypothetical protein n=1 Tax=Endozoicomonas sp. G2_2 TaxID=2821092 RepID=UPI001ADA05E9|nr:hypothetical protein [Endozoicomonas sp. G2_2]MBO9471647.1 hypothetical protein [Endozoicomonas sp. G2_2]
MAEAQVIEEELPTLIQAALARIRQHPHVIRANVHADSTKEFPQVDCLIQVNLPTQWRAQGQSPSGVKLEEPIRLMFSATYPQYAPLVTLRPEFNRNLAHIQPGAEQEAPEPCYFEGDPRELIAHRGIDGLLNQVVDWLHRAAKDTLIDPNHGWEPVRRDRLEDIVVLDRAALRNRIKSRGGYSFLETGYMRCVPEKGNRPHKGFLLMARVTDNALPLDQRTADWIVESPVQAQSAITHGRTLTVLVFAAKASTGAPIICDRYEPETVADLQTLAGRAADYGCRTELMEALSLVSRRLSKRAQDLGKVPLFIILVARRPITVLGSNSDIELIPYFLQVDKEFTSEPSIEVPVYPVALHDAISKNLLAELSGVALPADIYPLVQVGAGSVGSKIATHLGRAGLAPQVVIDKKCLSPHNSARHALTLPVDDYGLTWLSPKADIMCAVLAGLDQPATAIRQDAVGWRYDRQALRRSVPRNTSVILNSTASLAVREALAAIPEEQLRARIIESALYGQGHLGLLTLEGMERNPNTADLTLEAYALARADDGLRQLLLQHESQMSRQAVGQGCGTTTIVMSDARISLFAAAMSQKLIEWRTDRLPEQGKLYLGQASQDGMSLAWASESIKPFKVIVPENNDQWQIRISPRAHEKIQEDVGSHASVETGGVLIGALSSLRRTITVIDVLDAPEDSQRRRERFILGRSGLVSALEEYAESSGYTLYCVGTWHSHLSNSGASAIDHETVETLCDRIQSPALGLICLPDGYTAIVKEG